MNSKMKVRLCHEDGDGVKTPYDLVQVRIESNVKPGRVTHYDIPLDSVDSETEMRSAVEAAGAVVAEHQCVNYGDDHDPSSCAKAALEAFDEMWGKLERYPSQSIR